MNELSNADVKDKKFRSTEGFRNIKPQNELSKSELNDGVKEEFDKASNNGIDSISDVKEHYDDEGNKYRVGDDLLPNSEINKNGYKYKTDNQGRVVSAEGKLQVKDHKDRAEMDSRLSVGKGEMEKTDDRGHLIADRFNGSGGIENLVPMKGELNKGDYAKLENKLADAVNADADVKLKVEPRYDSQSNRPYEFKVSYSINGEKEVTVFKN